MHDHSGLSLPHLEPRGGALVIEGFGVKITVERGQLHTEDGYGAARRRARFPRAGSGIERLIVIGSEGFIALRVARWCKETGIVLVQLNRHGDSLMSSDLPPPNEPTLRRAQAVAATPPLGVEVSRTLLSRKLVGEGQALGLIGASDREAAR